MPSSLLTSFLGALQASLAVLLTLSYGVIATQFGLLSESSAKDISKTCVRLFLPALLIHNVGSQLDSDTGTRYIPVLLWSITYNVLSMLLGMTVTKIFKLPSWVTPAIAFNNTTSLPLLLVQSLQSTGILSSLLMGSSDNTSEAVDRAKSYFLVNAIVSNSLTFALGPKLLNGQEEDSPQKQEEKKPKDRTESEMNGHNGAPSIEGEEDVERGRIPPPQHDGQQEGSDSGDEVDEQTSLLPDPIVRRGEQAKQKGSHHGKRWFYSQRPWVQTALDFAYQFLNAPFIGAVLGCIVGLIPPFHRAFFNNTQEGGIFNAWLTSSIKNVGDLFAALQVIVVGVKLSQAMQKMKRGEASGEVPWKAFIFITMIRFVVWPLISIPLIWVVAKKTNVLTQDPILWFAMMLMPAGPPAMKLTALADVNGSDEHEKMSIAKFLTLSYAISPLIAFPVVGSLRAAQSIVSS
ncbi:hypothetical protein H2201_001239 [Coniosporium apollinis]|uniref:Auxin efflux carrier n=1 Tax=Coniosporium apollinis TaxID=61459 RepID=A0ABQ9P1V8_9PEZI|nr:hypothetical protein H2201_001239 [Coniosporium apollinis]